MEEAEYATTENKPMGNSAHPKEKNTKPEGAWGKDIGKSVDISGKSPLEAAATAGWRKNKGEIEGVSAWERLSGCRIKKGHRAKKRKKKCA